MTVITIPQTEPAARDAFYSELQSIVYRISRRDNLPTGGEWNVCTGPAGGNRQPAIARLVITLRRMGPYIVLLHSKFQGLGCLLLSFVQ